MNGVVVLVLAYARAFVLSHVKRLSLNFIATPAKILLGAQSSFDLLSVFPDSLVLRFSTWSLQQAQKKLLIGDRHPFDGIHALHKSICKNENRVNPGFDATGILYLGF